ncbi:MAG: hypothetical protein ABEJ59_05280 [Halanaeroarchaeum sp.]
MTDVPRSREDIEALAAEIATTPHPALEEETIDRAVAFVEDRQDRLEDAADAAAVGDLLAFWDGYVRGGVEDTVDDVEAFLAETSLRERFERGNDADLFGLDLFQGLMKLADVFEESADEVTERTADWARHVGDLTETFAEHLEDHKHP